MSRSVRLIHSSKTLRIAVYAVLAAAPLLLGMSARADAATPGLHPAGVIAPARALASTSTRGLITFTIQGTLQAGQNGLAVGPVQGPFGPIGSLVGKQYTLQFTFDPSDGVIRQRSTQACPPNVYLETKVPVATSSKPGTALLTSNGGSHAFRTSLANSTSATLVGSVTDIKHPCSPTQHAAFVVYETNQTLVSYDGSVSDPYSLGFPVDIWSSTSWPAPNCKYLVEPNVLYNYTNFLIMQFQINEYAGGKRTQYAYGGDGSGQSGATHHHLSFAVTNSLYPCKS